MKVYIAVCSGRDWKAGFGASLGQLLLNAHKTPDLEALHFNVMQASGIARARQACVTDAVKGGFTHILFLDDDMWFPPTLLADLLAHKLPIVGITYARKEPGNKLAISYGLDGQGVFSKGKTGTEQVIGMGFGGVLIQLDSIKDMPFPWFEHRWIEEKQEYMGEDNYFCLKAHNHGVKIYIDHDLSNKCAHLGDFPYKEI